VTTEPAIEVGQVWAARRDRHRLVTITHVVGHHWFDVPEDPEERSYAVHRNTSRRSQPISAKTLRRDYHLLNTAAKA
jgi:hypothetical protein